MAAMHKPVANLKLSLCRLQTLFEALNCVLKTVELPCLLVNDGRTLFVFLSQSFEFSLPVSPLRSQYVHLLLGSVVLVALESLKG